MHKDYIKPATAATSVTGRDDYITLKAMLYAIASIQSLPLADQEIGDVTDMRHLVKAAVDCDTKIPTLCHMMLEVNRHIGHMPDLWPNDFDDELTEIYEPRELAFRSAVHATINDMAKDMAAFLARFNADVGEAA